MRVVAFVFLGAVLSVLLIAFLRHRSSPLPVESASQETGTAAVESGPSDEALSAGTPAAFASREPQPTFQDKWGILISSIRLSMGGNALDVRYKVVDPGKAVLLTTNAAKTYVLDQGTGTNLMHQAPFQPLVPQEITAGKIYSTLFPNHGKFVKAGHTINLVVGGVRSEGFTVE
jgi:hypothetical protein